MKVSIPCAAALALFPLVTAFPAPNAAHGPLEDIIYGRGALEARQLRPRQSGGISSLVTPPVTPPTTTSKSTSAAASTSAAESTPPPPCAHPSFIPYPRSQFSPYFSVYHEHTTCVYLPATLDSPIELPDRANQHFTLSVTDRSHEH